ncbi:uncharacterized protein LOC130668814 [Microplitis mediator]|uniref:uncharacterized protein LOC130668814 n=1 Tax=Microplitis mediator TaxID=375433 RepID=UPI002553A72D|nr:uncharacterized protein LOC130668814 [Microplitis mediator]
MGLIMNDFQITLNKKGELSLDYIADQMNFKYGDLFKIFKKNFVTRTELDGLLERYSNDNRVQIFKKKLLLYKQNPWIKNAALLIKENEFDLEIDELFIQLWNTLDGKKDVYVSFKILKFLGFLNQDDNNLQSGQKACMRFIELLNDNNLKFKQKIRDSKSLIFLSIYDFKKIIKILGDNKITQYYFELDKIYSSYEKDEIVKKLKESEKDKKKISMLSQEAQQELHNTIAQVKELRDVNARMNRVLEKVECKRKDGFIYVVTSKTFALENKFKIGATENLRQRLAEINDMKNSHEFFYCFFEKSYDVKKVVKHINNLFEAFKDNNEEIIILHHSYLLPAIDRIIKNSNKSYDHLNDVVKLPRVYTIRGTVPPEKKVPDDDNDEPEENIMLRYIYNLLDRYIRNKVFSKTRNEFFNDLLILEVRSKFNKSDVWKIFKANLKWKKSKDPILYKNYQIFIHY